MNKFRTKHKFANFQSNLVKYEILWKIHLLLLPFNLSAACTVYTNTHANTNQAKSQENNRKCYSKTVSIKSMCRQIGHQTHKSQPQWNHRLIVWEGQKRKRRPKPAKVQVNLDYAHAHTHTHTHTHAHMYEMVRYKHNKGRSTASLMVHSVVHTCYKSNKDQEKADKGRKECWVMMWFVN